MKDLYSENYKSLMKEMEDHTNKYKCSQYWWTRKVNIVKMSALFKEIHRFNTIPNKIHMPFKNVDYKPDTNYIICRYNLESK